jgi:hypothetical protein
MTSVRIVMLAVSLAIIHAVPAAAQDAVDPVDTARIHLGPLGLTPSASLTQVGIDTNVFNDPVNPTRDYTSVFQPQLQSWLRLGRGRLSLDGSMTGRYFQKYSYLRSVDPGGSAQLDVRGNRIGFLVSAGMRRMTARPNSEIDLRARQTTRTLRAGVDVRVGGSTYLGVEARENTIDFADGDVVAGSSLRGQLARRERIASAFLRRELTDATTVFVQMDRQEDAFQFAIERNATRLRVTPGVELKPTAVIDGRAVVGYQRIEQKAFGTGPDGGIVASVDLSYTLRDRTRFTVIGLHDLAYSYQPAQPFYVVRGVSGSITQALSTAWAVTGRAGRQWMDYDRGRNPVGTSLLGGVDTVRTYGASVAYRLSDYTQVGVNADYQSRVSGQLSRPGYEGVRAGAFITYGIRGPS